jgi:exopolysaccharide biosynthesis polyprenyl glycosylphosphotransferase
MGHIVNIFDTGCCQNIDRVVIGSETARLVPGDRAHAESGAANPVRRVITAALPAALVTATLKSFSPSALGFSLCDLAVMCLLLDMERHLLHLYIPIPRALMFISAFIFFAAGEGLYNGFAKPLHQEFTLLAKCIVWATVPGIILSDGTSVLRLLLLGAYSLCTLAAIRQLLEALRIGRSIPARRNVLLLSNGARSDELSEAIANTQGCVLRGAVSDSWMRGRDQGELGSVARREFIDELVIATDDPKVRTAAIREARLNRLVAQVVPEWLSIGDAQCEMESFSGIPALKLASCAVPEWSLAIKRILDVVASCAGLILLSPVLTAVALSIALDSPGPVLYPASRVGKKGVCFTFWKFRTMVIGADQIKNNLRMINERRGAFFKLTDDPRVTRVGRVLRRYSLDELPQLWNVLRGEMSLVGPRPHPADDVQRYELSHLQRLDSVPGMTGLWQVTARRDPCFEKSVELDRQYITQWSIWLDLRILLKTCGQVVRGTGV